MILGRGAEITRPTDVAILLGLLMDHCDLTEFSFSIKDMVDSRGEVDIDYNIDDMSYIIRRTKTPAEPEHYAGIRDILGIEHAPDVIVTVGKTTSELSPRELKRARYGGPRGGQPQIGRD
jgi:hypothetical protein